MKRAEAVLRFIWDFVIGDDWRIAAGVALALGATAIASNGSAAVWWILPLAVAMLLALSVWAASRSQ
jgi:hypothetical protein